jgi:predicted RNA-binding Zn-ribbon protein involved in translation (DUF1610 family)
MTTSPQEARHMRCQRCGAGFPIVAVAPSVACPFCGNVQPMPLEIAQQLAQYQHEMAARADQVRQIDQASAQAERAAVADGALWFQGSWIVYLVMCGPAFLVTAGIWLFTQLGVLRGSRLREVEDVTQFLTVILTVMGMVAYWAYRSSSARLGRGNAQLAPRSALVCPSCGAPNVLAPGQVVHACGHCRSALLPTEAVIQRVLGAAEAEERRARMHWCRVQRRTTPGLDLPSRMAGFVVGMTVPPIALATGFFAPFVVLYGAPMLAPWALAVKITGWALGLLAAVGAVVGLVRERRMQRRWDAVTAALAAKLGGQRLDQETTRTWFDTYWVGPRSAPSLGPEAGVVAAVLDGFPALLVLDAVKAQEHHNNQVLLLVAATFTGTASVASGALTSWIRNEGFAINVEEGGGWAMLTDSSFAVFEGERRRFEEMVAEPERAIAMAEMLGAVVRVIGMSGGRPAQAMPR